jgi:tungstate transport system substrate-binding protein
LVLATTTSTADTGLLNVLNPVFESAFNAQVKVLSLGTGAALRIGENGDADVVMVHARASEDAFLQAGFGINRRDVMFNDFVIVGPAADPADIRTATSAAEAFASIAAAQSRFISRGDESGTNKKELAIWASAGVDPIGDWYLKVGRGMGDTLLQTNEFGAYTLSDRGTFLALAERVPNLVVLVEGPVKGGDPILLNPYGIMAVNPARFPVRNYALAMAYIGFLTSPEAQQIIADFRINDEPLFFPNALNQEANFEQYIPLNQN